MTRDETIVVLGLGYVGLPLAASFAEAGFRVKGLDLFQERVDTINAGRSPIEGNEPGLEALIAAGVTSGKFSAHTDQSVLADADAIFIVVQTPFDNDLQQPRYVALRAAVGEVGRRMKEGALVVVESTIAPTTMGKLVRPTLEKESGMRAGEGFLLGNCPERVMPGKLLNNLRNLDRVLGGVDDASRERMRYFYETIVRGDLFDAECLVAEIVKTAENAYRDVEIAFANELAMMCEILGVDVYTVRELVNKSPGRNVHLPGAGVGGHCIPKDSLLLSFGTKGTHFPRLMMTARAINDGMPAHTVTLLKDGLAASGVDVADARVCILGAAYLGDSDDIRNTPTMGIMKALDFEGMAYTVHDPFVNEDIGVPISRVLEEALDQADAVLLVTDHSEYNSITPDMLASRMRGRVLVDGRNVFSRQVFEGAGFTFRGVGK